MKMSMGNQHYHHLLIMTILSFISMFILMYAMVDRFANVFVSYNQFYMAGLMTAPMVLIELVVMRSMYTNAKWNVAIIVATVVALLFFFMAIRVQLAVSDTQFLRSMIPHHAGAILMCEKASIEDANIQKLCASIIEGQKAEIVEMKGLLDRPTE